MREMRLQELKSKTAAELVSFAEELEVENASTMRKQELMFGILKQLSVRETDIIGEGVVEVLSDGFGFLRSPDANYLPGDRKSTRLNSSHMSISYAVFCLKKKKKKNTKSNQVYAGLSNADNHPFTYSTDIGSHCMQMY